MPLRDLLIASNLCDRVVLSHIVAVRLYKETQGKAQHTHFKIVDSSAEFPVSTSQALGTYLKLGVSARSRRSDRENTHYSQFSFSSLSVCRVAHCGQY